MSEELVQCPKCGFEWTDNIEAIVNNGQITDFRSTKSNKEISDKETSVDLTCPLCEWEFIWPEKKR
jgi:predicted RNA-binding Zn-ribbon protein involved in translation (DUF1610 family)